MSYVDYDGFKKKKKAKLSEREKWRIAHGVDPDHDKTPLKKAKKLYKEGKKYTTASKTETKTKAATLIASRSTYSLAGGETRSMAKTTGFNGVLGSTSRYSLNDGLKDMLSVDKKMFMTFGGIVLSDMKAWKYVDGLNKVTDILNLAVATSDELGGIANIGHAWQHGWENIKSASGDEWLDAMTHSAASAYAISANTILSPLNATLRLVSGGHDLTVTGDETISAIQILLGE